MENQLIPQSQIKEVEFDGDNLLAISNAGKVYVGIKWVAQGIGLTHSQADRQIRNIREDLVLGQGAANLLVPTNGGPQTIIAIELDFLPLWLAKINVTPTMRRETPQVAEKLVTYQLKAKDVLASAFVRPKTSAELLLAQAELLVETERRMAQVEQMQLQQQQVIQAQEEKLSAMIHVMSETPVRSRIVRKVKELARHRNTSVQEAWHEIYWVLEDKYGIDLKRRVQNKRNRLNQERIAEGKPSYSEGTLKQKVNALDVILEEEMGLEVMEVIAGRMIRA